MDFALTEEQRRVREAAREVVLEALAGRRDSFEREGVVPSSVFRALAARGLLGVHVPRELGGAEAGVVAYSLALTEVSRVSPSAAVGMAVTNMVGEVIARFGRHDQKRRYNPRLCGGALGAFALSEVGAGSDPGGMRTTARRTEEGWVLTGTKQWISHADESAVLVVWARTGGDGAKGISCFLVEGGTPGLSVDKHEDKMGLRASRTCGLVLDEVRVPEDALLGEEGRGFSIAMMALDGGRIGIGSQALGIGEAALAAAVDHLREDAERAGEQGAQWRIADARAELDAARLLTLRAALRKERGQPFTQEASMAKLFSSEAAGRACQAALEVTGTEGWRRGVVERCLRDVRVTRIYEGTSEIQRFVIARQVLRG